MVPRSDNQVTAIVFAIAIVVGFSTGVVYGVYKGMEYFRETCEIHNTFYYKHNDTRYYCATEHQLKELQK